MECDGNASRKKFWYTYGVAPGGVLPPKGGANVYVTHHYHGAPTLPYPTLPYPNFISIKASPWLGGRVRDWEREGDREWGLFCEVDIY